MDRGKIGVSFIQYVQLNVFGNLYTLRPINPEKIISSKNMQVHVNNIQRNTPFYDS